MQVERLIPHPGFVNYLSLESFRYLRAGADGRRVVEEGSDQVIQQIVDALGVIPDNRVRVLLCVEGPTDVEALKAFSRALHSTDPAVPNLCCDPRVAFVVLGGGTLAHWVNEHYLNVDILILWALF